MQFYSLLSRCRKQFEQLANNMRIEVFDIVVCKQEVITSCKHVHAMNTPLNPTFI